MGFCAVEAGSGFAATGVGLDLRMEGDVCDGSSAPLRFSADAKETLGESSVLLADDLTLILIVFRGVSRR